MTNFLTELRGAKPSLAGGAAWMLAAWLWFGGTAVGAFGGDCGAIAGTECEAAQGEAIRRLAMLLSAIGPAGQGGLLVLAALLVGGTVNFLVGNLLKVVWPYALDYLVDWPVKSDALANEKHTAEWATAVRVRGEGLTRLTVVAPGALIIAAIAADFNWWCLLALIPLAGVGWHGYAAMRHFREQAKSIEERLTAEE